MSEETGNDLFSIERSQRIRRLIRPVIDNETNRMIELRMTTENQIADEAVKQAIECYGLKPIFDNFNFDNLETPSISTLPEDGDAKRPRYDLESLTEEVQLSSVRAAIARKGLTRTQTR